MDATLIHFGGAVKALGDGKVGGYLVTFSDAATPDLTGDYFTKETDFDVEDGDRRSTYYAHGLDTTLGVKKIGTLTVKADDIGVWVEAQLEQRDEYEKAIYELAAKGKLGWSSGAPSHLVTRKSIAVKGGGKVHEILTWPIAEGSLTPTPAEPRNDAIALKSLSGIIGFNKRPEGKEKKTLPAGWSYSDFRGLLQSELQEDFGQQSTYSPFGDYYPGVYPWLRDFDDEYVFYCMSGASNDMLRRSYTVNGNDIAWGDDETEVVERTVRDVATDTDDLSMIAGKRANVAALKEALTRSMTFGDHADIATSAMEGFVTRADAAIGMDIKAGRVISAANRKKMQEIHAGMQEAHTQLAGHIDKMGGLLAETDPDAKKDADEVATLRAGFLRLQSRNLGIAV